MAATLKQASLLSFFDVKGFIRPPALSVASPPPAVKLTASATLNNIMECMRLCEMPMTPSRQDFINHFCTVVALIGRDIDTERSPVCLAVRTLLKLQQCPDEDALLRDKIAKLIKMKKDALNEMRDEEAAIPSLWIRQVDEIAERAGTFRRRAREAHAACYMAAQQSGTDVVTAAIAWLMAERHTRHELAGMGEAGEDGRMYGHPGAPGPAWHE